MGRDVRLRGRGRDGSGRDRGGRGSDNLHGRRGWERREMFVMSILRVVEGIQIGLGPAETCW